MAQWTPDEVLDCRGLSCPMPILKTKKALKNLKPGQILEIQGTDPGTRNDLPAFTQRSGDELLGEEQGDGYISFFVKKG
ncbi:MAG: sulfurtransferase TusA family protein [Desulfarculus sp.]|jgi:tRNA 2-thiouridine synthesizing protein A|nr:MAG: sulfurtransferase TusA family protein [Desulfarculus sp.]